MRSTPEDLAHAQEEWHATYRQLAEHQRTELRRRLIRLSSQVMFHPYWQDRGTAARAALFTPRRTRRVGPGRAS
ncbi:hypothetical protein ACGFT2_29495 [Streptomyces sp. NPDC048514]|uniref:hypothetical protein n=1 Tax=Streptomyces sp. NPDC048514 TaxID=3365564 RepID=UPI0037196513